MAAAIGLAACSDGANPSAVASLGQSVGHRNASAATTPATRNPTQLLNQWAACMRRHGDPDQSDPTIDPDKVIHIVYPVGVNPQGQEGARSELNSACQAYLTAASTALGGTAPPQRSQAQLDEFSECMRANGVPNFPDLTDNGDGKIHLGFTPGTDLNPNNATYQSADTLCSKRTGVQGPVGVPAAVPGQIVYGANG